MQMLLLSICLQGIFQVFESTGMYSVIKLGSQALSKLLLLEMHFIVLSFFFSGSASGIGSYHSGNSSKVV
jgi:hypothetical protein